MYHSHVACLIAMQHDKDVMPECFKLASSNAYLDASLKHAGMTWEKLA